MRAHSYLFGLDNSSSSPERLGNCGHLFSITAAQQAMCAVPEVSHPRPDSTKSLPRLILHHELRGSWLLWHSNHAIWNPLDFLVWPSTGGILFYLRPGGVFNWRLERQAPRWDNIFFLNTQQIRVNSTRGGLARFLGAAATSNCPIFPWSGTRASFTAAAESWSQTGRGVCDCPGHVWSPARFWCVAPRFLLHQFL